MTEILRLGLVQMTSGVRHKTNVAEMRVRVAEAAEAGCQMVAFPEVSGMMNRRMEADRALIKVEAEDPFILGCRAAAKEFGVCIHTGSTAVIVEGETRFFNHSNLIDDRGEIVAAYDKLHLFDIFPDSGKPILESKRFAPGARAVLAETPWGRLGMSICYDLRFPALYRDYAQKGASMLFIPSAFTIPTGRAHWEVLLRARAIENGAFVVAAAQVGEHEDGRKTYGHAMVVDPWGRVLVDMEERVGLAVVEMDMAEVAKARGQIPSLQHGRDYPL